MAGTCDVVRPAVILAMSVASLAVIALWPASARKHHLCVLLLAHPGHRRGRMLEAQAIGGKDLGEEVDVPAELDHPVVIPIQHRLLLFLGHWPLVEILPLVGL